MQKQPAPSVNEMPYSADDEIDLFELWNGLVEEKWTIVVSFVVVVALAAVYAFLGPKTYEVSMSFLPPYEKDVVTLNFPGVVSESPQEVYRNFAQNLASPENILWLSQNDKVRALYDEGVNISEIRTELEELIEVSLPVESKQKSLVGDSFLSSVVVSGKEAEGAYLLASLFLDRALSSTKQDIKEDIVLTIEEKLKQKNKDYLIEDNRINAEIEAEIKALMEKDAQSKAEINEQIRLLREKVKLQREFQIERLQADYALAKKLGIHQPIDPLDYKRSSGSSRTELVINNANPSRYWLGTEILAAEIKNLKDRKNDDAYISGLADLKQKLKALEINHRINTLKQRQDNLPFSKSLRSLKVEIEQLQEAEDKVKKADFDVTRIVEQPVKPYKPVKPKKALILAVAGVLGLMLGVFIALIRRAVKKRRAEMAVS
jgi:LPS O-antigen subunit length determinant protein (WzzB/FepE family)